ncbi:MAG: MerR family transcriptional regulator [Desulfovibrio sp.]
MSSKYLSLREIGRQLEIPPSTVVYYKDKFERFIPSSGGGGRRKKYPHEALEVFRRIRVMFNDNWSTEQIEQELALKFTHLLKNEQSVQQLNSVVFESEDGANLTGVLSRMSDILDGQSLFRSEVRSLRDDLNKEKQEAAQRELLLKNEVTELKGEVVQLRQTCDHLAKLLASKAHAEDTETPPAQMFEYPLVIRSEQGEFLGALSHVKKFALRDFIDMIDGNAGDTKHVSKRWEKKGENWVLVVSINDEATFLEQHLVLVVKPVLTPSNNHVTQIVRLNVNGKDVPDAMLLTLFKQVREGFGK